MVIVVLYYRGSLISFTLNTRGFHTGSTATVAAITTLKRDGVFCVIFFIPHSFTN